MICHVGRGTATPVRRRLAHNPAQFAGSVDWDSADLLLSSFHYSLLEARKIAADGRIEMSFMSMISPLTDFLYAVSDCFGDRMYEYGTLTETSSAVPLWKAIPPHIYLILVHWMLSCHNAGHQDKSFLGVHRLNAEADREASSLPLLYEESEC